MTTFAFVLGAWHGARCWDRLIPLLEQRDQALTVQLLFGDADPETAHSAFTRLRPQALYPYSQPFALTQFPQTPRTYVICTGDQMVNPDWSRQTAHKLDARLLELPGDHSPFLSRPAELADLLGSV